VAAAPEVREHVCPYLYAHPELFSLHRPLAPQRWQASHIRLTIDTPEDYEHAQSLFAKLDRMDSEERYQGEVIINMSSTKKDSNEN
jgi:spore coat polysaccharide biosynthesis protein SpsF